MTDNYLYDKAVVIGRFQPFHNGHLHLVSHASRLAREVIILVGSPHRPRDFKNPFTYAERRQIILDSLQETFEESRDPQRLRVEPVEDTVYNDSEWVASVQNLVADTENESVVLVGHKKDASSYYLDMFPQYTLEEVEPEQTLDATAIREMLWDHRDDYRGLVPEPTANFLEEFEKTQEYEYVSEEYKSHLQIKESWSGTPHPVIFSTTDAVIICKGHILVVRRRSSPGKGLWALPGGFVKPHLRLFDSALEEVYEETRIRVPRQVLEGSYVTKEIFDDPGRSLRGRTVTTAFLFNLKDSRNLPKVKGGDDADKARWITLSEFYRSSHLLFEDHYSIVRNLVGNL